MLSLSKIGFLLAAYQVAFIQCNCPNVIPVDNFSLDKFASGTWYDVAVSRNSYPNGELLSTLTYKHSGGSIFFSTPSRLRTDPNYIKGSGSVAGVVPGKMIFYFDFGDTKHDADMTVVALDEDFMAIYGCIDDDDSTGITWVSSKQENPDDRVKAKIQNFLDSYEDPTTNQKTSWKSRI